MSEPSILLHVADPQRRQSVAEMLRSAPAHVLTSLAEIPEDAAIDVIVTDNGSLPPDLPGQDPCIVRDEPGVISLDEAAPADVSLPADFTPRELRLACALLAEIVRLRRERRQGVQMHKTLRQLAMSDPLTGLPNRRAWEEELAARWQTVAAEGGSLCVALFDIDQFKRINDECGHAAGDAVLQEMAKALAASVRPGDHVARLGGDEFGLLVSSVTSEDAASLVDRVRRSLQQDATEHVLWPVTASAGYAILTATDRQDSLSSADLIEAADSALRHAKSQGRNRTFAAQVALRSS